MGRQVGEGLVCAAQAEFSFDPLSPEDMLLRFWEFFLEGEKRRPCSLSPFPGDC